MLLKLSWGEVQEVCSDYSQQVIRWQTGYAQTGGMTDNNLDFYASIKQLSDNQAPHIPTSAKHQYRHVATGRINALAGSDVCDYFSTRNGTLISLHPFAFTWHHPWHALL
jgi:hypothetical protein